MMESRDQPQSIGQYSMAIDSNLQRKIMGRFATGIPVVTTAGNGGMGGLTANAVASLSLDPPLVLVAVDKRAGSYAEIAANRCYAVNILSAAQEEVSRRFAIPGPKDFPALQLKTAVPRAPLFDNRLGPLHS